MPVVLPFIANNAFDIVQPDPFHFGGMIRSMKVARTMVPHLSSGELGYLCLLHFTSTCANASDYHESTLFATKDANGTTIPIESRSDPFTSVN